MKRFLLSLQHLLAMYAGAILVPIIVGTSLNFTPEQIAYLVTVDIFMCGVATFLQVYRGIGIGLPVVLGCTFTAVSPMILIGQTKGIDVLYGSLFLSGLLVIAIAPFFASLVKLFPPVVTGSVVTIIGITLMPVAMNYMAGGQGAKDYGDPKHIL
ncbi:purine permease, partial [Staphylococcus pseudintermedius]